MDEPANSTEGTGAFEIERPITPQEIVTMELGATYWVRIFEVTDHGLADAGETVIRFCKGNREDPNVFRQVGFFTETLIAVAKKYLEDVNVGELATRETSMVITKLDEALLWIGKRASDRAARGVQGAYRK